MKKTLYFAGPLFSNAERQFNLELTAKIEALGIDVFLPQRDGPEKLSDFEKMPDAQKNKIIHEIDRDNAFSSNIFLYILDGRVPDEGAAAEMGMAYAQKFLGIMPDKIIIGLDTDWRWSFRISKLNQMISGSIDEIFQDEKNLLNFLENIA